MRVTNSMNYRALLGAMQERTQAQFDAQQALSTGRKFQQAKDDPVAAAAVLRTEDRLARLQSQQDTLNRVEARHAYSETRLSDLGDTLQSARELLLRAQTVSINTEDRDLLAEQLRGMAADVASIANTRDADGRPLFGGTSPNPPLVGGPGAWTLAADISAPPRVEVADGRQLANGVDMRSALMNTAGTADIVTALETLADAVALNPTDNAGKLARRDTLDAGLVELDGMLERTSRVRSQAGLALEAVDTLRAANDSGQLNASSELAQWRDADIAAEVTRLANENASLEAARAVFQRLGQQSLFNFLR